MSQFIKEKGCLASTSVGLLFAVTSMACVQRLGSSTLKHRGSE